MIKFSFFAGSIILMLYQPLSAQTWEVIRPCAKEAYATHQLTQADLKESLGDLTLRLLNHYQIDFQGTAQGINQIDESPVGLEAMDVISDTEMFAYGWCFRVNRVVPELYANQVKIPNLQTKIQWYYGYAHYRAGEWIAQCVDSYLQRKSDFCQQLTK